MREGEATLRSEMRDGHAALRMEMMEVRAALRSEMREDYGRIMKHLVQMAGDLGEVRGELNVIGSREMVGAGGS